MFPKRSRFYFSTDRPRTLKSEAALLPSEKDTLKALADTFKQYLAVKPDARLVLSGHADRRGMEAYNKPLSVPAHSNVIEMASSMLKNLGAKAS